MVSMRQSDGDVWVVLGFLCVAYCIFSGAGGLLLQLSLVVVSIPVVVAVGWLSVLGIQEICSEFKRGYNETEA
jgi:hypothetical protein